MTVLPMMKPVTKPIAPEVDRLIASAGSSGGDAAAPPCRRSGVARPVDDSC